jgi:hypothetical protein
VVYKERLIELNVRQSEADVLLCTFEITNAGFFPFLLRENFSPESHYTSNSPMAFSQKQNPASCDHQRNVKKKR